MLFLGVMGLGLGGLWLMRGAARRFAERQRHLGRWDAEGPLVETEAPHGNRGMNERLEVAGEWHGAILRDRRSESNVAGRREPSNKEDQARSDHPPHSDRPDQSDSSTHR
jgi:hypothetical protein